MMEHFVAKTPNDIVKECNALGIKSSDLLCVTVDKRVWCFYEEKESKKAASPAGEATKKAEEPQKAGFFGK